MKKYRCTYNNGSGEAYDGGIWAMKETAKKIIFEVIEKPYFDLNYDKLECSKDNRCKHTLRDWGDGTYTVYPNANGTPYLFEPLEE